MKMAIPLILLAAAGCTAADRGVADAKPPVAAPGGGCDTAAAQRYVGQKLVVGLGAQALAASGAADLRVVGPDTVVTMDYRPDRLNVMVDADSRITGFRCG